MSPIKPRLAALSSLVALSLMALSATASAADKLSVVTSLEGSLATTAYVAKELGYFDAAGLDVDIFDGGGGSNAVAALVGGSAQVGLVGIKNTTEATAKGQPLRVVATAIEGFPAALIARVDLTKQADLPAGADLRQRVGLLKGRTVAVNDIGGSTGDFVRYVLAEAGMGERDVTLINLASSAGRLAGLKARKIDAAVGFPPEPEMAVEGGYASVLADAHRDVPALDGMDYMVHAVRLDDLQQHRDVLARYVGAIGKAQEAIRAEPAKAKAAYYAYLTRKARGLKLNAEIADRAWTDMLPYMPKNLAPTADDIAKARKFFQISGALSDADIADTSLAAARPR